MQHMAAAKAEGGDRVGDVANAQAAAQAARAAGNEGAAHFKDHWQPEGPLQVCRSLTIQVSDCKWDCKWESLAAAAHFEDHWQPEGAQIQFSGKVQDPGRTQLFDRSVIELSPPLMTRPS